MKSIKTTKLVKHIVPKFQVKATNTMRRPNPCLIYIYIYIYNVCMAKL